MESAKILATGFTLRFVLEKLHNSSDRFAECQLQNLENFHAEDITAGSAFFSQIIRITFTWKSDRVLPKSIVLKVPGVQKFVAESADKTELDYLEFAHSNEQEVYAFLMTESAKLDKPLKIPNIYYSADYSRHHKDGLMIMDDLSPLGSTLKLLPGLNNEQVEATIDELARIHVLGWKHYDAIRKLKRSPGGLDFVMEMKQLSQQLRDYDPDVFNPLMDKVNRLFSITVFEYATYHDDKFGFPPTLVHADLWSSNILFEREQDVITDRLLSIIDWQSGHQGNPGVDFGRLLAVNTTSEYRRHNTARLLQRYFDAVSVGFHGQPPLTLAQLHCAYDAAMGFVSQFLAFGVTYYYNMPAVIGTDDAQVARNRAELLDRARCFLEDTLTAYEARNIAM